VHKKTKRDRSLSHKLPWSLNNAEPGTLTQKTPELRKTRGYRLIPVQRRGKLSLGSGKNPEAGGATRQREARGEKSSLCLCIKKKKLRMIRKERGMRKPRRDKQGEGDRGKNARRRGKLPRIGAGRRKRSTGEDLPRVVAG